MNMMFVFGDKVVTPALNGSILPGITRDSVLKLAKGMGLHVEEKRISIDEVMEGARSGKLTEAFGTGTAAVVSPVNLISYQGDDEKIGDGNIGTLTQKLYDTLTGMQTGKVADTMGWITKL